MRDPKAPIVHGQETPEDETKKPEPKKPAESEGDRPNTTQADPAAPIVHGTPEPPAKDDEEAGS